MPVFAKDCLAGKTVLITGGLGALGKVIIGKLLSHSADVVVNDIVPEEQAQRAFGEAGWPHEHCSYIKADVSNTAESQMLVARVLELTGRLDVALCHAGIILAGPVLDCSEWDWDRMLHVNLKGAFLVAQAAARAMVQMGIKGKIIFTSSWGQDVPWTEKTPYNVSKSGVKMLMRGMARELAPRGIRVNAIAPGIVDAGMTKRLWERDQAFRRRSEKAIPLGYLQPAETVADGLLFLCSPASDYMTGSTLLVDGGCSLYPLD
jgi:NAD(P)-dependent dehydrogenase (short-subunit alcohol dehydrogenase family)